MFNGVAGSALPDPVHRNASRSNCGRTTAPPPRGTVVVGGPANLLDPAMVDGTKIDAFIAQRRDTSGLDDP